MLSSIDLERIYFEKTLPDAKDFDLIVQQYPTKNIKILITLHG